MSGDVQNADPASSKPPNKIMKQELLTDCNFFADFFVESSETAVDEVNSYPSSSESSADILSYWQTKEAL